MIVRILVSAGVFLLGYYLGKEIERMAPIRERLRDHPGPRRGGLEPHPVESPSPLRLAVPYGTEWPVQGWNEGDGILLRPGFLEAVEAASGLEAGALDREALLPLLMEWYVELRRTGMPVDEAMERLMKEYER